MICLGTNLRSAQRILLKYYYYGDLCYIYNFFIVLAASRCIYKDIVRSLLRHTSVYPYNDWTNDNSASIVEPGNNACGCNDKLDPKRNDPLRDKSWVN